MFLSRDYKIQRHTSLLGYFRTEVDSVVMTTTTSCSELSLTSISFCLLPSSPFRSLRSLFSGGSKGMESNRVSGIYEMYLRQVSESGSPGLCRIFLLLYISCCLSCFRGWVFFSTGTSISFEIVV